MHRKRLTQILLDKVRPELIYAPVRRCVVKNKSHVIGNVLDTISQRIATQIMDVELVFHANDVYTWLDTSNCVLRVLANVVGYHLDT